MTKKSDEARKSLELLRRVARGEVDFRQAEAILETRGGEDDGESANG